MAKAKNKTQETEVSVEAFIATVEPERRRDEAHRLVAMFRRTTGKEPKMWGPSIIGFGRYDYKYESGREGTAPRSGFSPRKAKLSIYLMGTYCTPEARADQERLFGLLGKHSVGKSCLYINRLEQIDENVLEELITKDLAYMDEKYPA